MNDGSIDRNKCPFLLPVDLPRQFIVVFEILGDHWVSHEKIGIACIRDDQLRFFDTGGEPPLIAITWSVSADMAHRSVEHYFQ